MRHQRFICLFDNTNRSLTIGELHDLRDTAQQIEENIIETADLPAKDASNVFRPFGEEDRQADAHDEIRDQSHQGDGRRIEHNQYDVCNPGKDGDRDWRNRMRVKDFNEDVYKRQVQA